MAWKRNKLFGNSYIEMQELEDDGIELKSSSEPITLLTATSDYQDEFCVEAPWFIFRFGHFIFILRQVLRNLILSISYLLDHQGFQIVKSFQTSAILFLALLKRLDISSPD